MCELYSNLFKVHIICLFATSDKQQKAAICSMTYQFQTPKNLQCICTFYSSDKPYVFVMTCSHPLAQFLWRVFLAGHGKRKKQSWSHLAHFQSPVSEELGLQIQEQWVSFQCWRSEKKKNTCDDQEIPYHYNHILQGTKRS